LFKTPLKFIKLAPLQSVIILIGSALTGLIQSFTFFSLIPLSDQLGLPSAGGNKILSLFKSMLDIVGLNYSLATVLIFMVAFIGFIALINFLSQAYSARVSAKLVRHLRLRSINTVLGARWSYFTDKKSGQFVHSILTEAGKTTAGYIDSINFFSAIVQGLVIFSSTFFIDARVAILGGIVGLLIVYLFKGWIEKARLAGMETGRVTGLVTETMTEGMGGIKPLKTMHRDHFLGPLLVRETKGLEQLQYRLFVVSAIPKILREPIITVFMVLGLFIIVSQSILPVTNVIPLVLLFQRTAQQFGVTQSAFQSIKKMEPFLEGLEDSIRDAEKVQENWPGELEPHFNKEIQFRNVGFAYGKKVILNGIDFTIRKNEFVALVGPSGTGKTTLVDILCGLYTPASGRLSIDDKNILDIDIRKWRRSIGYVPQDLFLFHDTIANNITLGDPLIEDIKIEQALKSAGAWDFVSEFPEGIQKNIGERGLKLSGGQRQRVSIARALVSNPQLLILDEATVALDPETEREILKKIKYLSSEGLTIVAISHQQTVLDIADKVYRLEAGRFVKVKSKQKQGVET